MTAQAQPSHPTPRSWKTASVLVPSLLLMSAGTALADRIERHFKVEARPVVTLHNPTGTVTVRAWTKSEVLVIAKRATDRVQIDTEQNANRVEISTRQIPDNTSLNDLRTDFEISVPEDTELQIHNDSGGVNVSNVLGDMNVETIGAEVALQDAAGYLNVNTVDGGFQCSRCAGRIEAHSISGNLRFIDTRSYHVHAQTSEGNIFFNGEFFPSGIYQLKNYSGVIEVRFSPGDSFDISATSLKGKVNNEAKLTPSSHHHSFRGVGNALFGSMNTGRAKVELSSFNGTINILKRD
jgi:DUF4097 and DUF4098 domain-containing protein YvlB